MPILTAQERIGTCIGAGRYRIERLLARGGMSVLFEATDTRTFRAVAIKLLRAEDCIEERRVARFMQEMRLTAELRNPHVVDVLDLGQDENGVPYLVMELLRGRTLQAELDERSTLSMEDTMAIVLPVMSALAAVHSAGVVHRDVKPDNIFLHLDAAGRMHPKLLDFGIAKLVFSTMHTRTGAVLGTPDYMAPEQVLCHEITAATDVWAMGAVIYRALSGETPFRSESAAQVLAKLTREPAPLLRVPGLPPALSAAVDRALVREVSGRYSDMTAFAKAIVTCAREAGLEVTLELSPRIALRKLSPEDLGVRTFGTQPSQESAPVPRRRARATFVAALLGVSLIGAAALALPLLSRGDRPPEPVNGAVVGRQLETEAHAASRTKRETARADSAHDGFSAQSGFESQSSRAPASTRAGIESGSGLPSVAEAEVPRSRLRRATAPAKARLGQSAIDPRPLRVRDLPIAVEW